MKNFVVLSLAVFGLAGFAQADIIPSLALAGQPTFIGGGQWNFAYTAAVTAGERLDVAANASPTACNFGTSPCVPPGVFFTIYDFGGFVSVGVIPASWTFSTSLMGVTPSGISVSEDAAITNVTFNYTGAPVIGPAALGTFNIVSTLNGQKIGQYSAQATNNDSTSIVFNKADQNRGPIGVPAAIGVPEPASMLMIGGGLVGLALLRRKLVR